MRATISDMNEHDQQCKLMEWSRENTHRYRALALLFAIPNGGHRVKSVARDMKAEGVKAGIPDLHLPVPVGEYHGLWVELKTESGKTSDDQDRWLTALNDQGYLAVCVKGWENAAAVIEKYLLGLASRDLSEVHSSGDTDIWVE